MAKMGSVSVQMKDLLDEFSDELDKLVKDMKEGKTLHFESASDAQKWMDSL